MDIERRLQLVEEKVDRLIQVEEGTLIAYSNDPTEVEIAQEQLPSRRLDQLHTWIHNPDDADDNGVPNLHCSRCKIKLSDCGATEGSWYCA